MPGITLVMGGCHINGQFVGGDLSFPTLLLNADAVPGKGELVLVPHVSAKAAVRRIRELIKTHRVSQVILQIGHWESICAARYTLPWRRPAPPASGKDSAGPVGAPKFTLYNYIRSVLAGHAIQWLGFDRDATTDAQFQQGFDRDVGFLLDFLESAGIANVLVLSCFPTADDMVNRKRRIANRSLKAGSERTGATYLDLWQSLSFRFGLLRGVARPSVLADSGHLNAEGHRLVAAAIASVLADRAPILVSQEARGPGQEAVQTPISQAAMPVAHFFRPAADIRCPTSR